MVNLGVIGLGLIGGSMAKDLKARGFAGRVFGVECDPLGAEAALKMGLADEVVSVESCCAASDIIAVAIPSGSAVTMVCKILDMFREQGWKDKVVIDTCSVKEQISLATRYHPCRSQFVSTHPMAGTEYSGPWAAMPGLFDGRACIMADAEESSPKAQGLAKELYDVLNMRLIYMNSSSHDIHAAYVSHISHITSFALALTVLDKERDEKHIFDMASGGFSSTVRLAKSNPEMWVPILMQNRDNVLKVIDTYIEKMEGFRQAIADYDENATGEMIRSANRIKKILR